MKTKQTTKVKSLTDATTEKKNTTNTNNESKNTSKNNTTKDESSSNSKNTTKKNGICNGHPLQIATDLQRMSVASAIIATDVRCNMVGGKLWRFVLL